MSSIANNMLKTKIEVALVDSNSGEIEVRRYATDDDSLVGISSQQHRQTQEDNAGEEDSDDNDVEIDNKRDSKEGDAEAMKQTPSKEERQLSQRYQQHRQRDRQKRKMTLFCLMLAVIITFLLTNIFTVFKPTKNQKRQEDMLTPQQQTQPQHTCTEEELADLNENRLELSLKGLTRPLSTAKEQEVVEQVVLEAYNEVSGGCRDIYERWMYQSNIVNQTIAAPTDDYDYDYGLSLPEVIVELEMDISCYDCPTEQEFASIFPTNSESRSRLLPFEETTTTIDSL